MIKDFKKKSLWSKLVMTAMLICMAHPTQAQLIAGKTNALLWGTLTPNFSLELVTSDKTSVMAGGFYSLDQNPLDCNIKGVEGQVRYWVSGRPMVQSFIGLGVQAMRDTMPYSRHTSFWRCRRSGTRLRLCIATQQAFQHRIQCRNFTDVVQREAL